MTGVRMSNVQAETPVQLTLEMEWNEVGYAHSTNWIPFFNGMENWVVGFVHQLRS
jgi:hypothetical protein